MPDPQPSPSADGSLVDGDGASLLQQILSGGHLVRDMPDPELKANEEKHARDLIGAFVDQVLAQKGQLDTRTQNSVKAIQRMVDEIDKRISEQLDTILHHKKFRDLEARWRGLHYLVMNSETG